MTKEGPGTSSPQKFSDDVLDLFVASGRHEQIKGAIERRFASLSIRSTPGPTRINPPICRRTFCRTWRRTLTV